MDRALVLRWVLFLLLNISVSCQAESDFKNEPHWSNNEKSKNEKSKNQDKKKSKNSKAKILFQTPTQEVSLDNWPLFEDDIDFEGIELAIERQIRRYKQKNLANQSLKLGNRIYPARKALQSLETFRGLVSDYKKCLNTKSLKTTCKNRMNQSLKNQFRLYAPKLEPGEFGYGDENFGRFTGYYTPLIKAYSKPHKDYPHAIYSLPATEEQRTLSRTSTDFDLTLKGQGLELFYTKDLFELYLLHVQGGGKVSLQDRNEEYYISYAGTNGQKWRFISLYMREQGYIQDLTIESQREFLLANPHMEREIYEQCPSYVYFKISNTPPEGSDVVPLTDGRSIATDRNFYAFKGLLSFVMAQKPVSNSGKEMHDFSRFFIDQDTGGAIRGKARVDIYHGEGEYAENAANNTDVRGQIYFLMLK